MSQLSANVCLTSETFGVLADKEGRSIPVEKFIWQTRAGLRLSVLNLDAAIVELWAPDSDRVPGNVLLAPDTLQEFLQLDPGLICGACVGPSDCLKSDEEPNKKAEVGGKAQAMASDRIWQPFVDGTRLHLSRQLVAGRRNTLATVTISVEPSNVVHIHYQACGVGKVVRLSHRWLLNLGGRDGGPSATHQHVVQINANMLVDGRRTLRTAGSNMADFRNAQRLGMYGTNRANEMAEHYLLNNTKLDGYGLKLIHSPSGRAMELYCDFPWLRFTTLDDLPEGKGTISPSYPHHGLRRLSLLFDLNRFITSIVDVIEGGKEKRVSTDKQRPSCTGRRFVKHSGMLVHPKYIEFPVPGLTSAGSIITEKLARSISRPTLFNANVRLKFGLCRARHCDLQQSDGHKSQTKLTK